MSPGAARWLVIAAAVLFSTGGAGIKAEAFTGLQVSAVRSGVAALVLFLIFRTRLVWSVPLVASGVVYAAALTTFVLATKLTTAANAIFLQSTAPLYIVLLAPVLLHERLRRRDAMFLAALAAGLVLCVAGQAGPTATAPDPPLGNLFGLLSAVAWALTLVALRHAERNAGRAGAGMTTVVTGNLMASLAALPFAWPFPSAPAVQWTTLVYLGVFQIGLAYVCLTSAIRRLPAIDVSLLLLVEPVLNPVWTWLIRSESPGTWTLAGGAIVLVATAVKSVVDAAAPAAHTAAARNGETDAPGSP